MGATEKIYCFEAQNRKALITKFYENESDDWHTEVHENRGSCAENIEDSLKTIESSSQFYEVLVGREVAGMFTIFRDEFDNVAVECFHVMEEYRTKEFFSEFWKEVKRAAGGQFWIGVFEQNVQAVNHLKKQGFILTKVDVHRNLVTFIFKSN